MRSLMITFYDISSRLPHSWSPNTLKTRLCLAYKGLEHKTEWVEFPDIAALCKEKKIPATAAWKSDGSPYYSLPAIIDHRGGIDTPVSESFEIAEYLDKTYPETKRVVPEGEEAAAFQRDFPLTFRKMVFLPYRRTFFPRVAEIFEPASKEHFSRGRAIQIFDTHSLDEIKVESEEEKEHIWNDFKEGWSTLDREYYSKTDARGPWLLGETLSFADFQVAAYLICFQRVFGKDSDEWKRLRELNQGRWGRLFDETQYLVEVEH